MRLSGIDPGIIRELSGIYKPFVKAFKELVSNAYDADATEVLVTLSDSTHSNNRCGNGTPRIVTPRSLASVKSNAASRPGTATCSKHTSRSGPYCTRQARTRRCNVRSCPA